MADHDHPYKLLFSHAEMVRDLLVSFVKEDWVHELDFSTLERRSGSFVSDDLRERETDLIWSVRWGARRLYVYLLIEFQSSSDRFMAVRVMCYLSLLYQDLLRTGAIGESELLPAVLPMVLYNGKSAWTAPLGIEELLEPVPVGMELFRPSLRYLLLEERRFATAELATIRNAVAGLFRLEASRSPAEVRTVLHDLLGWLRAPEQAGLRQDFAVWLRRTFLPGRLPGQVVPEFNDLQEVDAMLSETVVEWTEQWKQEGLEQGLEQGLQEGRQEGLEQGRRAGLLETARRMLEAGLPRETILQFTGLSAADLDALK